MVGVKFELNGQQVEDYVHIQRFVGGPPDHLAVINMGDRTLRQLIIEDQAGRLTFSNVREAGGDYVCWLGSIMPGGRATCWVRTPATTPEGAAHICVYEKESG